MAAGKLNLKIEQDASFRLRLYWKDERQRAINLTGYSAVLQMRNSHSDAVLLEMSTANGKIVLTPTTGAIDLTLTDEETGAITWLRASYDLSLEDSTGTKIRLVEGKVTVVPSITHA